MALGERILSVGPSEAIRKGMWIHRDEKADSLVLPAVPEGAPRRGRGAALAHAHGAYLLLHAEVIE